MAAAEGGQTRHRSASVGALRPWTTGNLRANGFGYMTTMPKGSDTYSERFIQNNLPSKAYETLPIGSYGAQIPNYTGHVPGGFSVVGQRKAAASAHTCEQFPQVTRLRSHWAHLSLVDLRPEQRSLNKNYMYAEEAPTPFLRFPTRKTFDHRKL